MPKMLEPITPGFVLKTEFIEPLEITLSKLAKDIGVPTNRISQIINGKREITTDTALRLGRYFGMEPEFWLNLQMRYNLKITERESGSKIEREVHVLEAA